MFLILGLFSLFFGAHGAPVDKSVYDVIKLSASVDKCPYVRETKLVEPEPEFLKNCKDLTSAQHITALDYSNVQEALCLLYYNSFKYLCIVSDQHQKQIKSFVTNSSIDEAPLRYHKKEEVCSILKNNFVVFDNEYKNSMLTISTYIKQNEEACFKLCTDFDGKKVNQICSLSAYMLNTTSTLLTLKADSKVLKPSHTEHMEHSLDNAQSAAQSHSEQQVTTTKDKKAENPTGLAEPPPQSNSQEQPKPLTDNHDGKGDKPQSATDTKNVKEPEAVQKSGTINPVASPKAELAAKQAKGAGISPPMSGSQPVNPSLPAVASKPEPLAPPEPEAQAPVPPEGNEAKANGQPAPAGTNNEVTSNKAPSDEKSNQVPPPAPNKSPEASNPKEESAPNTNKGVVTQAEVIADVTKLTPEQPAKSAVETQFDINNGVEIEAPDVNSNIKVTQSNDGTLNQPNGDGKLQPVEGVDGDPDFIADGEGDPLLAGDAEGEEEEGDNNVRPAAKGSEVKQPIDKSKPHEVNEDGTVYPVNSQSLNIDDNDSYFFSYFMMVCIMFICGYVAYHNKQKILALVVEGRQGRRPSRTRRPNSANYRKLDSNLEEAITSSCKKNTTQVIY